MPAPLTFVSGRPASHASKSWWAGTSTPPSAREDDGYFSGSSPRRPATATSSTGRRRASVSRSRSRFQPEGPHGPSEIVDPTAFPGPTSVAGRRARRAGPLRDARRDVHARRARGRPRRRAPELARIGITVIELMPVAEFDGRFGWGYDGVDLFAPSHLYGRPDDFRRFVDRAHALGHRRHSRRRLQPPRAGRQLPARVLAGVLHRPLRQRMGRRDQLRRPGRGAGPRVLHRERRLLDRRVPSRRPAPRRDAADLRRLGRAHIIAAIGAARAKRPPARTIVLVAENEPQDTRLVRPTPKAATASTRCGTTTSITARWWR